MLHAGVLMKLGGYGACGSRFICCRRARRSGRLFFMALTTVNILYGSFGAIMQKDLKYFTAYSSVSHCGFVLFGVAALNLMGLKGAVIQMFSHGIMTGLFFGLIGMVYGRTHTRMIAEMGGLAQSDAVAGGHVLYRGSGQSWDCPACRDSSPSRMYSWAASSAIRGTNPTMMRILTILATMSIVVTAVYVLRGLAKVFMGPIQPALRGARRTPRCPNGCPPGMLVATLVVVGLVPWFLIDLIETALMPILNRLYGLIDGGGMWNR